jgi:hypothetical protein
MLITTIGTFGIYNGGSAAEGVVMTFKDPQWTMQASDIRIPNDGNSVEYRNTINVHVVDKDGANLSGATVNLEGSDSSNYDTDMWTADSITTDANGTISTEAPATDGIVIKKWEDSGQDETDYNVFRMTLSKAGYETLVMENITIDSPIDWHLELQYMRPRMLGRYRRAQVSNFN